jgi:hypothetical protein
VGGILAHALRKAIASPAASLLNASAMVRASYRLVAVVGSQRGHARCGPLLKDCSMKKIASYGVLLILLAAAVIVPLEIVEAMLAGRPLTNPGDRSVSATPDQMDPARPGVSLYQFDLYPFTGGHTQANMVVNSGKFRTGKHGFMTEIDVDNPPPKKAGEIRLIMVGGSAAAGHGATANEKMIHSVMEREFKCEGKKLTVINLAMGGSRSYQNFIALNLWGHKLQPDAILSFSGNNDLNAAHFHDYDGFQTATAAQALLHTSSDKGLAATVARHFPNLMNKTALGIAIRAFSYDDLGRSEWKSYTDRFSVLAGTPKPEVEIAKYVHAVNSIRRDFSGLPLFLAYQPFMASEKNPGKTLSDWKFDVSGRLRQYGNFIARTSGEMLDGPQYGPLTVVDVHAWYQKHYADEMDPGDGTHMWDNKQELVGRYMLAQMTPALCKSS